MNFFRYAYLENRWLWFHILAGGFLTRLGLIFFKINVSAASAKHWTFVGILALALAWEAGEYIWKKNAQKPFSADDSKRFFMDAFGDVSGALVACLIILI